MKNEISISIDLKNYNWDQVKKEFSILLDKNEKLSARKIITKKGVYFREKHPEFNNYSFSRIFYIVQNKTFEVQKCKVCGKNTFFDERLKKFKNLCYECRYQDRVPWNKGLTKENNESVRKIGEAVSEKKKGRPLTEKEMKVIQNNTKINREREYCEEQFKKAIETNLKKYGVKSYLELVNEQGRKSQKEKYGEKMYAGSKDRKEHFEEELEKRNLTNISRYGGISPNSSNEVKNRQITSLKNNGNMYFGSEKHKKDLDEIQRKNKETSLKRYQHEFPSQNPDIKQKRINTLNERDAWFLHSEEYNQRFEEFLEKKKQTSLKNWGTEHHMGSEEIKEKVKKTNLKNWGTEYYFQSEYYRNKIFPIIINDIIRKINESKKKNESFNLSVPEKEAIKELQKRFKCVFSQYSNDKYPYKSDAFIPELNLFIEFNFHWTHGKIPFTNSKENKQLLEVWKEKSQSSDFYQKAIDVWTISDVIKRAVGKNLNWIEFFNELKFKEWISSFPEIDFLTPKINIKKWELEISSNVFNKMLSSKVSYKKTSNNKYKELIIPFVFDEFYKKEISLLQNFKIVRKLFQNRYQYLNKDTLSQKEIFEGFSKAGIQKGFSTFSPLIIKAFIKEYNVKSIYDPCGGWGSRMLGAWNIDYHYNDANSNLLPLIKRMYDFYSLIKESGLITFSSENAATFIPNKQFDAIFTCPPYFNVEDYGFKLDSAKMFPDYSQWLDVWWRSVIKNSKKVAPIFAYVISSDFAQDMNKIFIEEGFKLMDTKQITIKRKNHLSFSKEENLYIFQV